MLNLKRFKVKPENLDYYGQIAAIFALLLALVSIVAAISYPDRWFTLLGVCLWATLPPLYMMLEHQVMDREAPKDERDFQSRAQELATRFWGGVLAVLIFFITIYRK